jgi:16S rRNA (guanine527-N7)-methyltransferase
MDLITHYFPNLDPTQLRQFAQLGALYADWNTKINVISRKDIDNFYEHHVLHSLAIAKALNFVPGTKILDVGTGGGFPGLPLAIMFPECDILLVDSIGKKLKVIDDIAEKIGVTNVRTQHERAENIAGEFDFITSRAVTRLDEIWGWVSSKISSESKNSLKNGLMYLKGGDISAELPAGVSIDRFELNKWFSEDYFIEKALIYLTK